MFLGKIGEILKGGADVLDKVITTKEEKMQLINELREIEQKGMDSARSMYKVDNSLQKIYALVFLASYMVMILVMIVFIFKFAGALDSLNLPEWAISFLSILFGGMSTKVGTITDFLFGGSKTAEIQERRR